MFQHPVDFFVTDPTKKLIQGGQDITKPLLDWSRPIVIAVAAIAGVMGFFLIKSYLPAPHRQLGTNLERSTS